MVQQRYVLFGECAHATDEGRVGMRATKKRPETSCLRPLPYVCCGGVLLSHNLSVAVPLALPGLASRFGMEAGRFPGAMTTTSVGVQHAPPRAVLLVGGVG